MPAIGIPFTVASISGAASGDNTIVAAVAGKSVRVYRLLVTLAAGSVTIKDGAGISLSGAMTLTGLVLEDMNEPLFVTTAGNALIANLSGTNQLSGTIWYTQN